MLLFSCHKSRHWLQSSRTRKQGKCLSTGTAQLYFFVLHETAKISKQVLILRATLTSMQLFQSHFIMPYITMRSHFQKKIKIEKPYIGLDQWFIQPNSAWQSFSRDILWERQALIISSFFPLVSILFLSLAVYV